MARRRSRPTAPRGYKLVRVAPKAPSGCRFVKTTGKRRKRASSSSFIPKRTKARGLKAAKDVYKFSKEKAAPVIKTAAKDVYRFSKEKAAPYIAEKYKILKEKYKAAKQRRDFKKRGISITESTENKKEYDKKEYDAKGYVDIDRPAKVF